MYPASLSFRSVSHRNQPNAAVNNNENIFAKLVLMEEKNWFLLLQTTKVFFRKL